MNKLRTILSVVIDAIIIIEFASEIAKRIKQRAQNTPEEGGISS